MVLRNHPEELIPEKILRDNQALHGWQEEDIFGNTACEKA